MTSTLISSDEHFNGEHTEKGDNLLQSENYSKSTICYRVQSRDTLCSIAVNFNTTTSALKKLNKMTSTMIFPGQDLLVPDIDAFSTNEELSTNNASVETDEYDFLAPLSASPTASTAPKPFRDLIVVSSVDQRSDANIDILDRLPSSSDRQSYSSSHSVPTSLKHSNSHQDDSSLGKNNPSTIERMISVDSCHSEPFEENFVKITTHYITEARELVRGVLLNTPTSVMFDPDPNSPLAKEQGCEKFGIMCDLTDVISIAVYRDTRKLVRNKSVELPSASPKTSISEEKKENEHEATVESNDAAEDIAKDGQNKEIVDKDSNESDSSKLMFEFPFLHSLVKTVEDYLPGIPYLREEKAKSPTDNQRTLYLCIKSQKAMMQTFMVLATMSEQSDGMERRENDVREAWFQIPGDRSDQLFAFFMQWSPDPYALDFAEENGFIDASTIETKKKKRKTNILKSEVRGRSSTESSLEFIDDYFGDAEIHKEWELISVNEAGKRAKLNANDLANDDTSLMPEMLQSSNLIKDPALLELCRHIPARCVGCPWRLLYSTFEHGMSLRTLYRKMNQRLEDSPAVLVIQDNQNHIFGAFCSTRPRVSDHFYGSGESFLFALEPNWEFFEWSGENTFFIKGDTDALMFGGGDGTAGLWLDGDLRHGRSKPCFTFNNTLLSGTEDFFIHGVEVWGFEDS